MGGGAGTLFGFRFAMESSTPPRDTAWAMSEKDVTPAPEQGSIVLATFKKRGAAERMLASLGRNFRHEARKGKSDVFVISANADGSLKVTESRVVEASGFISFLIHIATAILVGFLGLFSTLKEAFRVRRSTQVHAAHVGMDDMKSHGILAQAGEDAVLVWFVVRTRKRGTRWSRKRLNLRRTPGMARSLSSSPTSTRGTSTTGCVPLLGSRPARIIRPSSCRITACWNARS